MKIAVLFAGTSEERDVSVASAAQIIPALRALGHDVFSVDTATGRLPPADEVRLLTSGVGPQPRSRQFAKRDQFAAELQYFSQCILDDRTPEPSGAEGLADVRVIEAMHRSIQSGRWEPVRSAVRKRRPTLKQGIRRPPVPRESDLVDVKSAGQ